MSEEFDDLRELLKESSNKITITKKDKTEELIKAIHELQRLPKQKQNNYGVSEKTFADGTDMRNFYDKLLEKVKKIFKKNLEDITESERQCLNQYQNIKNALSLYVSFDAENMSEEQKIEELIKAIHELQRLPKTKKNNYGVSEKTFADGTDMRSFYDKLLGKAKKISKKNLENITESERQSIANFIKIFDVLNALNIERVSENERTEELIRVINMYNIIPSKSKFFDKTSVRLFYDLLSYKVNTVLYENIGPITKQDQNSINNLNKINELLWQIAFKYASDYLYVYGYLNVIRGYKVGAISLQEFDLRKWLDEQRENYFKEDKDELQLRHEAQLNKLSRNWLGKEYTARLADFMAKNITDQNSVPTTGKKLVKR